LVSHASETDLNRDFTDSGQTSAGWFIIALMFFGGINYFVLRTGLA
jgi:hypothetical protein